MSTYKHAVISLGGKAAADYSSAGLYRAAAYTAATKTWTLASVAGQKVDGVMMDDPKANQSVAPTMLGIAKWECGGTVAAGDRLATDANGKAVTAGADEFEFAEALEAGVDGRIISVLIKDSGYGVASQSRKYLQFEVDAADIADGDVITAFPMNHAGEILAVRAVCTKAVTTAAKASDLNIEIGTTDLTGGVVALAGTYALGAVEEGTAITAGGAFAATDTISIEASSTTAFIEGRFCIVVEYV